MTREEAKNMIKNDIDLHHAYLSSKYIKALKIAISELEHPKCKTGYWIEAYDPFNRISGRCSACSWEAHLYEDDVVGMDYCPNCGARMEINDERHD